MYAENVFSSPVFSPSSFLGKQVVLLTGTLSSFACVQEIIQPKYVFSFTLHEGVLFKKIDWSMLDKIFESNLRSFNFVTKLKVSSSKILTPWKKNYTKPKQCIKKQRHHFADRSPYSKSYSFSSSHARMWELDHTKGWVPKNWCFWMVVLEKTLETPLDSKVIYQTSQS